MYCGRYFKQFIKHIWLLRHALLLLILKWSLTNDIEILREKWNFILAESNSTARNIGNQADYSINLHLSSEVYAALYYKINTYFPSFRVKASILVIARNLSFFNSLKMWPPKTYCRLFKSVNSVMIRNYQSLVNIGEEILFLKRGRGFNPNVECISTDLLKEILAPSLYAVFPKNNGTADFHQFANISGI